MEKGELRIKGGVGLGCGGLLEMSVLTGRCLSESLLLPISAFSFTFALSKMFFIKYDQSNNNSH